jgi:hypothetical protein
MPRASTSNRRGPLCGVGRVKVCQRPLRGSNAAIRLPCSSLTQIRPSGAARISYGIGPPSTLAMVGCGGTSWVSNLPEAGSTAPISSGARVKWPLTQTRPSGATATLWGYIPTSCILQVESGASMASCLGAPSTAHTRPRASRSMARGLALSTGIGIAAGTPPAGSTR